MNANPAIETTPALGITVSVRDGIPINDHRTEFMQTPMLEPRENLPHDDANRINHALKHIDANLNAVFMSSLLDIPAYLLIRRF